MDSNSTLSVSITDAAAHLNSLLQTKEADLKEKEAEFSRRVLLFEKENPSMGKENDIIQINVGGSSTIAVLRQTLTQFDGSMLAAKFSGRWDDSLEKDRDGNFFVDQDPTNFNNLVSFLRLKNNRPQQVVKEPKATYEFCFMLEYYNLMPGVYPQKWVGKSDSFTCEEVSYDTFALCTNNGDGDAIVFHDFGKFACAGVSEFTVEFKEGTTGTVGWLTYSQSSVLSWVKGDQEIANDSPYLLLNEILDNSMFLKISERKIFGPTSILAENIMIEYEESPTTIICRRDGNEKYSIEAVGISPSGGVAAKLQQRKYSLIFPMISFSGKVIVSGLKYRIDNM